MEQEDYIPEKEKLPRPDSVQAELIEAIDQDSALDSGDLDAMERFIDSTDSLGDAVHNYFRSLIPKGIRQPRQEYSGEAPTSYFTSEVKNQLEDVKQAVLEGEEVHGLRVADLVRSNEEVVGPVEESQVEGFSVQEQWSNYVRNNGLVILEHVKHISHSERKVDLSLAELAVVNRAGVMLDLKKLLPAKSRLRPADLKERDMLSEDEPPNDEPAVKNDLKNYHGIRGSQGKFFYGQTSRTVHYGDLTEEGSMLGFLHEVAHAWQHEHLGRDRGQAMFLSGYIEIVAILDYHSRVEREVEQGEADQQKLDAVRSQLEQRQREYNFEVVETSVDAGEQDQDIVRLRSLNTDHEYLVRSPELRGHLSDYVLDERDAWAHAIRVIRFLRRHGLDLDPTLQTLEDIRERVHPALASYEEFTQHTMPESGHHFSRLDRVQANS